MVELCGAVWPLGFQDVGVEPAADASHLDPPGRGVRPRTARSRPLRPGRSTRCQSRRGAGHRNGGNMDATAVTGCTDRCTDRLSEPTDEMWREVPAQLRVFV